MQVSRLDEADRAAVLEQLPLLLTILMSKTVMHMFSLLIPACNLSNLREYLS